MLVGREAELGELARLAAAGGAVVLVGDAGIGKTALLRELRDRAEARVLTTTGVPTESDLAFGGVAELLGPVAEQVLSLDGPRGEALASALALGPASPGDRLAVAVGTLDVLRAVAPVLVLVDDLQWLDAASRECLLTVARRCGDDGVTVVACARPGTLPEGHGVPEWAVGALSRDAARRLLDDPDRGRADEVLALAQGNPLALRELPKALADRAPGMPGLPVDPGEQVTACFVQRIDRLSAGATRGLVLVAASHDGRVSDLVRAYEAEGLQQEDLDEAEAAELVVVEGDRVRFEHPLVQSAVYHRATAGERRRAHGALGEVVDGSAAVWHRSAATTTPDEEVAAGLDAVAAEAHSRRGYHLASTAYERAARLSSEDFGTCLRLLAAGAAALAAGEAHRATTLAEEATRRAPDPMLAAGGEHLAGVVDMWHVDAGRAERRLRAAAERFASSVPHQSAAMLADASLAATSNGDCRQAVQNARRAHELAADAPAPVRAHAGTALAWALLLTGAHDEGVALYQATEPLLAEVDPLSPAARSIGLALNIRSQTADLRAARAEALALSEGAELAGALAGVAFPLGVACEAALRLGAWDSLEEDYQRAILLASETRQAPPLAFLLVSRARLRAARGDAEGCRADVDDARAIAGPLGMHSIETYALSALGLLALGGRELEQAASLLTDIRRTVARHGQRHPTLVPWAAELVEALCRLDRSDEAVEVIAEIEPWCAGPAGAGLLARCRSLVAGDDFEGAFAEAARTAADYPLAFDDARTLLALGERRRRALHNKDARGPLRDALHAFERLGAVPWKARAEAELRAAGDAASGPGTIAGLSGQQTQIALAVAGGARNREVAERLFLSEKTVEYHLSRIYRHAGVRSRTELARWLAEN